MRRKERWESGEQGMGGKKDQKSIFMGSDSSDWLSVMMWSLTRTAEKVKAMFQTWLHSEFNSGEVTENTVPKEADTAGGGGGGQMIMTFVNEVMQLLQKDGTSASQPGRRYLRSQSLRQGLSEPNRSHIPKLHLLHVLLIFRGWKESTFRQGRGWESGRNEEKTGSHAVGIHLIDL